MKCNNPYFDKKSGLQFNCGKCHACRVNTTSQWTVRCLYELDRWKKVGASFITLTYDNEHLPKDLGLHPEDLSKFFKRLRINLNRFYQKDYPILYRACGEYGDKEQKYITFTDGKPNGKPLGRPHYHAIVYGLDDMNDNHRNILINSWTLCDSYMFDKNRKDSGMLPVCREDIAYVCGYVQKKLNGNLGKETYGNREPPFSRSSRGLGLDFAQENLRFFKRGFVTLNGQKVAIPRYFRERLGLKQSELIHLDNSVYDNNDYIFSLFRDYLNSLGLSWLLDDPIKNSSAIERRWYSWYEKKQNEWSDFILDQYNQGRMIRGRKI